MTAAISPGSAHYFPPCTHSQVVEQQWLALAAIRIICERSTGTEANHDMVGEENATADAFDLEAIDPACIGGRRRATRRAS